MDISLLNAEAAEMLLTLRAVRSEQWLNSMFV